MKRGDIVELTSLDPAYRSLTHEDRLRVVESKPSHAGNIGLDLVTCLTAEVVGTRRQNSTRHIQLHAACH